GDFGVAVADDGVFPRQVAVLDGHVARRVAPEGVEAAQCAAGEIAFDAWAAERAGHHAVELSAAAEGHGPGRRAEIGHDAREHLIAFLPVAAGDLIRETQRAAARDRPLEGDVRALLTAPACAG